MPKKIENCSYKPEKTENDRFYQNLQFLSELKNTLIKLANLFGGLIPIQELLKS